MPAAQSVGLVRYLAVLLLVNPLAVEQLFSAEDPAAPQSNRNGDRTSSVARADSNGADEAVEENIGDSSERQTKRIGTSEQLSFLQSKVVAEMNELEQRMFRLAESLKTMEPENSSRLMLGLKYARQELILHQMREAVDTLKQFELAAAEIQQEQLLEKLERLQQLLLSDDLDFQLQLERLRQIRKIMKRLELVVRDEDHLQQQSAEADAATQALAEFETRLALLERLIQQQQAHLTAARKMGAPATETPRDAETPSTDGDTSGDEAALTAKQLAEQQTATRQTTANLAKNLADAGQPHEPLQKAERAMERATASLAAAAPEPSIRPMRSAWTALREQRDLLRRQAETLQRAASQQKLASLQDSQAQNRQFSEEVAEMIRGLGANATAPLKSMSAARSNMQTAEGALGQSQPDMARSEQQAASAALREARRQLEAEARRLLDRLQAEVKLRVIEGLTLMLEKQQAIRASTARLGPGVAKGSRPAISAVLVLAGEEEKLGLVAGNLIALVEETEFGVALPAALWVVRDGMEDVQAALGAGKADANVVADEEQIEADLTALLEAMKNLPTKESNSDAEGGSGGAQEELRELNRLVAELKMIRILQLRINRNTTQLDEERQAEAQRIAAALRRRLLELQALQEDVRDVTEELAIQRGDELQ